MGRGKRTVMQATSGVLLLTGAMIAGACSAPDVICFALATAGALVIVWTVSPGRASWSHPVAGSWMVTFAAVLVLLWLRIFSVVTVDPLAQGAIIAGVMLLSLVLFRWAGTSR